MTQKYRKNLSFAAVFLCLTLSAGASGDTPSGDEDTAAPFDLGVAAYDRGDYSAAYRFWLPLAEQGDLAAKRNTALLLRKGLGVKKDTKRAFKFYKEAADAGLASAQVNLAALYAKGIGTEPSDSKAAYYYARAAKAGHANAQYRLALMLEKGKGAKENPALALSLFKAAARQHHSLATEALQRIEARTEPVRMGSSSVPPHRPIEKAMAKTENGLTDRLPKHSETELSAGQRQSLENALEDFAEGERGEALGNLRHLAAQGVAEASYRAGEAYLYGAGAPQNLTSAFAYFQQADAYHHPLARQMMKKTLTEMKRQALDQMDPH